MQLFAIASCFAMMAVVVSLHTIAMHLRHYTQPRYQRYICRILLIVPLHASQAWCSLVFPSLAPLFDTARDVYEAYVIYMFFSLLTAYLGGEDCLIDYLELKSQMSHPGVLRRCCRRINLGRGFLLRVKQGTLQFVLIRPATGVLALILHSAGLYDSENWSFRGSYLYLSIINNLSVSISLYSLVLFYNATEVRLQSFRPLPKFLSIKAIVFFSYWQGFILSLLVHVGAITSDPVLKAEELVDGDMVITSSLAGQLAGEDPSMSGLSALAKAAVLQDLLICVEIFIAALALSSAFSYRDFADDVKARRPLLSNLAEVLDPQDLAHDAHSAFILPQGHQSLGPRSMELHEHTTTGFVKPSDRDSFHSSDSIGLSDF